MKKPKIFILLAGFLLVLHVVGYLIFGNSVNKQLYSDFGDVIGIITSFAALYGMFLAASIFRAKDLAKRAWSTLLFGVFLYFIAEVVYVFYRFVLKQDMDLLFPSVADWIWIIGYVPLIVAFLMFLWGYRESGLPMGGKKFYSLLLCSDVVFLVLVWFYLFVPIFNDRDSGMIERFVYCAYIVGDLVLITLCVVLSHITRQFKGGSFSRPWKYIAFGFIFITFSDIAYSYLTWQGGYTSGGLIDLGWSVGYLLIALGGVYQREVAVLVTKER
jgi:hypothetical protein